MSIPIKVWVQSKSGKSDTYRRVTLHNPSFEAVEHKIREWVRGEFVVSYKDDEDDAIAMDIESEWQECVRIWERSKGGPLRITVTKIGSKHHEHDRTTDTREEEGTRNNNNNILSAVLREDPARDVSAPASIVDEIIETICGDGDASVIKKKLSTGEVTPEHIGCESWLTVTPTDGDYLDMDIKLSSLVDYLIKRVLSEDCKPQESTQWLTYATKLNQSSNGGVDALGDIESHCLNNDAQFAEALTNYRQSCSPHPVQVLRKSRQAGSLYKSYKNGWRAIVKETKNDMKKLHRQFKASENAMKVKGSLKAFQEVLQRRDEAKKSEKTIKENKKKNANGLLQFTESQTVQETEELPHTSESEPFESQLATFYSMGFTHIVAMEALTKHNGDLQKAVCDVIGQQTF